MFTGLLRSGRIVFVIILVAILLLLPLSLQGAVKSEECLDCHEKQKGAVHGKLSCTACHSGIEEVPHAEKLERPRCGRCHEKAEKAHGLSVHRKAGLACGACHNTHFVRKESKECTSCHKGIPHKTIPSKAKHLSSIPCLGCHGQVSASAAAVIISPRRESGLTREMADPDGSGKIDRAEWDRLMSHMSKEGKGAFKVERKYALTADVHSVAARPAGCGACHTERKIFPVVRVSVQAKGGFQLPAEPGIFIPNLPPPGKYADTVHGRRGVGCADCHVSEERTDDRVCAGCHGEVYEVYKGTVHAQKGATVCTDCHDPHNVRSYKELAFPERVAVCARCHKDYLATHRWLPHTTLHFYYLECSTCHSPKSTRSMVFSIGTGDPRSKGQLSHADLKRIFGEEVEPAQAADTSGDGAISSRELTEFFQQLKRQFGAKLKVNTSIIVTNAYHDYSAKSHRERVCETCHSEAAPFYDSMFLLLPGRDGSVYLPVKGTTLSSAPVSVFVDMCLLGETKIKKQDLAKLFSLSGPARSEYVRELGFKWIDLIGLLLILAALFFVVLHIIARVAFRR